MATGWPMKTTYADGDVYSAQDVNDITGTINLLGSSVAYAAGKNKIINGAFDVWQRGTSFASIASNVYFADRFAASNTAGGGTITFSQQTFTPGTAPVSGYESKYFARLAVTSGSGSTVTGCYQKIEDVRTLAGQTITVSFWAKADSARTLGIYTQQNFGSGGSGAVTTSTTRTLTTSWARYTYTLSLASISGKTVGTSSFLYIAIELGAGQASGTVALDTWGWQVEEGSTATAFQTATGTIQGELAACQRYYYHYLSGATDLFIGIGALTSSSIVATGVNFPVSMRTTPTLVASSGTNYYVSESSSNAADYFNSFTITRAHPNCAGIYNNTQIASTAGQSAFLYTTNASASIAFSSEL
jgi:hypothetical protein